jgi:predicted deacylase
MMLPELRTRPGDKVAREVTVDAGVTLPVTVIHGEREGKTMLVTAGIHGGEYLGIRAATLLAATLTPRDVAGRVVVLHCCNPGAFFAHRAFVVPEDGKNLNAVFPGDPEGSLAERIAHVIATAFIPVADVHVDIHCGDIPETLVSHVYYSDSADPAVNEASREMALASGADYAVPARGMKGPSHVACQRGIPSVLIERGASGLWSEEEAQRYVRQLRGVLAHCGLIDPEEALPRPRVIAHAFSLTAPKSGCWLPRVEPGDYVGAGEELGTISDFFGNVLETVVAAHEGVVLYMTSSLSVNEGGPLITYGSGDRE